MILAKRKKKGIKGKRTEGDNGRKIFIFAALIRECLVRWAA
jgi:hypothetical protein